MNKKTVLLALAGILASASATQAQLKLDKVFENIFNKVLNQDLILSPGDHARHYLDAAADANRVLTPALNALIASNVSSFPLTATTAGVTFDWSTGRPVSITQSLGPIFAETAETLGKGKINAEVNFTYLNLAQLRGLATKDTRFAFFHEDVDQTGILGDTNFESDILNLTLGFDVNASIFVSSATVGVTNNLDIGLAIPIVNVRLSGEAHAVLEGPTSDIFHILGANDVIDVVPYDESATGLGDVALRLKYSFVRGAGINLAAFIDARFPTGEKENFLGTGKTNTRFSMIGSKKMRNFSPHINLGYNYRPAEFDSDELELAVGFDQKVAEGVTVAVDLLGELKDAIQFLPEETVTIVYQQQTNFVPRKVDLTNIPQKDYDNTLNAAFGFRIAPSERALFLGNILVPLNDGGLRPEITPTIGMTLSF
ncbi:MAG: transporter [bacterium]